MDRALASDARCRRFESAMVRQKEGQPTRVVPLFGAPWRKDEEPSSVFGFCRKAKRRQVAAEKTVHGGENRKRKEQPASPPLSPQFGSESVMRTVFRLLAFPVRQTRVFPLAFFSFLWYAVSVRNPKKENRYEPCCGSAERTQPFLYRNGRKGSAPCAPFFERHRV